MSNSIIDNLKQLKKLYKKSKNPYAINYYNFLLKEGKTFTKIGDYNKQRGKTKQCYYNAQMLAIDDNSYIYYEGFGTTKKIGIPFEHGFNVKNNKVIDPTWKDGTLYFGIPIPLQYVKKHMFKTSMAETLLFKYFIDITQRKEIENEN